MPTWFPRSHTALSQSPNTGSEEPPIDAARGEQRRNVQLWGHALSVVIMARGDWEFPEIVPLIVSHVDRFARGVCSECTFH